MAFQSSAFQSSGFQVGLLPVEEASPSQGGSRRRRFYLDDLPFIEDAAIRAENERVIARTVALCTSGIMQ